MGDCRSGDLDPDYSVDVNLILKLCFGRQSGKRQERKPLYRSLQEAALKFCFTMTAHPRVKKRHNTSDTGCTKIQVLGGRVACTVYAHCGPLFC